MVPRRQELLQPLQQEPVLQVLSPIFPQEHYE
jgi:hypothetical protein